MVTSDPDACWTSHGIVARNGSRLNYAVLGEGEPVVLLPKLGGWIADWRHIAPALAASGRRVIAFDAPGHGGSIMAGPAPYLQTVLESAAFVMAALDDLGIDRFALVGCSLGGGISIAIAASWPHAVTRLSLISVNLIPRLSRAEILQSDAELPPGAFGPDGRPLHRTASDLVKFGITDPQIIDEQNRSRDAAGLWVRPSERGFGRFGAIDYLAKLTMPTLLIYGDRGHYIQYAAVGRERIDNVEIVHIPNCAAFPAQEKPAETAEALIAFLDA